MHKSLKLALLVLAGFVSLTLLHVWLNIGVESFNFARSGAAKQSFRVGFLPVT